jgi:hypothetical protein
MSYKSQQNLFFKGIDFPEIREKQKDGLSCGCSSGVERNLAKVDVARSNRVTRYLQKKYFIFH